MIHKLNTSVLIVLLFLGLCASIANCDDRSIQPDDAYIVLDQLLVFSNKSGDDFSSTRKKWTNLVYKLNNKSNLSEDEIKLYLFIIFVSDQNVLSHTNEVISEKIVQRFSKQPEKILEVLDSYRFLIPPTQAALKRHFMIVDETSISRDFIRQFQKLIIEKLGAETGTQFINAITM